MYTLIDIIDKFIDLEKQAKEIYRKVAAIPETPLNIKSVAKVLQLEEERHVVAYEKIKKELQQIENLAMIDFIAYDKTSSLFNEFKTRFFVPNPRAPQELIQYAYAMKLEHKALAIDIQGRLLERESENGEYIEKILGQVIEEEERAIRNLKQFLQ